MATDELAMRRARASVATELTDPFLLEYANTSNRFNLLKIFSLLSVCTQVQFSVHTFCTDTGIRV